MENKISGLTKEQVNQYINEGKVNKVKKNIDRTYGKIIIKNVFTFFNILLFIIGAVLIFFGKWNSCFFLVILITNLVIGLTQDIRSKRLVDKLNLINKSKVKVIRDNQQIEINPEQIVLNDILHLTNGEQIPCDSTVIFGECHVDESLLTGESDYLKKGIESKLFSGTYITNGDVFVRVDNVGEDNYIEKLQKKSKNFKASRSEMYLSLNRLFKILVFIICIIGIADILEFIFLSGISYSFSSFEQFKYVIGNDIVGPLAGAFISMIPSGMYLLTSTTLAVGIINLATHKVIVQDMYSIETIARMDVFCLDKTGTITDGSMNVKEFKIYDNKIDNDTFLNLISSSNYYLNDDNFTALALKDRFGSVNKYELISKIPFNSKNKYSVVNLKDFGGLVIGAYNFIKFKNSNINIEKEVEEYSRKGLRVLVVGKTESYIEENSEFVCDFVGFIIIQDKIRDNAKDIIKWFKDNDVDIKIISGDNVLTVSEISNQVGIDNYDKYISLEGLSEEEVKEAALKYSVFGRVSPEQKELIIRTLKENGHKVGMIGDGINDVLSLKQANVSVSLKSASKSAQNTANIVLMDDDFSHFPEVIAQGRRVINNLARTCSLFLVKTTFSIFLNVFFILFALITRAKSSTVVLWPFEPNNFYAWEIASIGLASFFLALEPSNERFKGKFMNNILKEAVPRGATIAFVVMVFYIYLNSKISIDSLRSVSTYFISIISLVVLFKVCYKLNVYRIIVFSGSVLLTILMFSISIFCNGPLNLLKLEGEAPRFLSTYELEILLCMLGLGAILLLIGIFVRKAFNIGKEYNEKN